MWNYLILYLEIQAVVGILLIEYIFYKCKTLRTPDKERDAKFPHICRTDLERWSRVSLYPYAATIMIPRFFFLLLPSFITFFFVSSIAGIGMKQNQKLPKWRVKVFRVISIVFCQWVKLATGVYNY